MSVRGSPIRDVKFIPETPPSTNSSDSPQEHVHSTKKPRNYKYWSDDEVKKILQWLNLPENEGKLARNKAQACREVAKKLFDGDEYMAISVRSKLMSLEKGYREAEQLRQQLNTSTKDEALIQEKIKEVSKYHRDCKQLFGGQRSDNFIPPISTSPITPHISTTKAFSPSHHGYHPHTILPRPDCEPTFDNAGSSSSNSSTTLLPHLNEDRLRVLSIPPHVIRRGSWSLPRVNTVDLPPVDDEDVNAKKKRKSYQEPSTANTCDPSVRIARYAAKQASYAAKQAEYEAQRSEYEQNRMKYAIRLAEIELDRDALSIKKLELELELLKSKEQTEV